MFRPVPVKYFVVHADVATQDGLVVRISFSNLFKEFKSTSTWLQFPFVCHAASSSISGAAGVAGRGTYILMLSSFSVCVVRANVIANSCLAMKSFFSQVFC